MTPLRQRMIEDMSIRQFGPRTQHDYVRVVADFARFLGRSPDQAEPEDLRRYQLHLASKGASPAKMNAAVSALRFFFKVTLARSGFGERLATVRKEDRLPEVLSPEEVALLLHCAPSLKHKAALSIAYGCGLRVSEIVHLKVADIDSARMLIRVEQGRQGTSAVRSTRTGFINTNGQVVLGPTGRAGSDHLQKIYALKCQVCGHEYGANGPDIAARRCPNHDGGRPGFDVAKVDVIEVTAATERRRNPNWTRDELILALDVYLDDPIASERGDAVLELSRLFNTFWEAEGVKGAANLRNPSGVYMKLGNFQSLDPAYRASGRKGLAHGGQLEQENQRRSASPGLSGCLSGEWRVARPRTCRTLVRRAGRPA